jgi:hypothetical protein
MWCSSMVERELSDHKKALVRRKLTATAIIVARTKKWSKPKHT